MRIKNMLNLLIIVSVVLITFLDGYAVEKKSGIINVAAKIIFYGDDNYNTETEWLKVEVLSGDKQSVVFEEIFEKYSIKEGWIKLELGLDKANPLNPNIFTPGKNWIKITLKDDHGTPPSVIITMNAVASVLYSNVAYETPTGNLFPAITKKESSVLMINDQGDSFEYVSTGNLVDLFGIENKESINNLFSITDNHENHVLMVKNNEYEKISTAHLFEELKLDKIALKGVIPDMQGYPNHYLQVNETGTGLKFVDVIASLNRETVKATANLFTGEPSQENNVFLWNDLKGAYEAQPTSNLGFIGRDEISLSYNSDEYKVILGGWSEIDISDLLDNTDNQKLDITGNRLILTRLGEDDSELDLDPYFVTKQELDSLLLDMQVSINSLEINLGSIDLSLDDDVLTVIGTESSMNLIGYKDNTDSQQLSLDIEEAVLFLDNSVSINLGLLGREIGTDDQRIYYDAYTNIIALEGSTPSTIDLSDLQDNTDSQELSMLDGVLNLTRLGVEDSSIDFKTYLGSAATGNIGEDVQAYSSYLDKLSDNGILEIDYVEDSVYFIRNSGEAGKIWTADGDGFGVWGEGHDLSIAGNILSLTTDDTSVDLSKYQQVLSFNNNILSLSNGGGEIDFGVLGTEIGTDDQEIIELSLSGSILRLELEDGGGFQEVDLQSIDTQLTDQEIADMGYIKIQPVIDVREDFEAADLVLSSNITNNTINIAMNADRIIMKQEDVASNTSAIETNENNISINAESIASNKNKIEINREAISLNTIEIEDNAIDIANNLVTINNNRLAIEVNKINKDTNIADIDANITEIANNAVEIMDNSSEINSNTALIENNTVEIANNKMNISSNRVAISSNINKLESLQTMISSNSAASELADTDLNTKIDNLDIELNSNDELTLSTVDATPVDLSSYKQQLSFVDNILSLTDGGSIDFGLLGTGIGTDDQEILEFSLSGTELRLDIEGGGVVSTVNLSSVDTQLSDEEIGDFGYMKLNSVTTLRESLEAKDTILENNIDDVVLAYTEADSELDTSIRTDFGLVDVDLAVSINSNLVEISNLEIEYQSEDSLIREDFTATDVAMQAEIDQNELDRDSTDEELRVSIDSNVELIRNLEIAYQGADSQIRSEFSIADSDIQLDIDQQEVDRNTADQELSISINNNTNMISSLEDLYALSDTAIREEFAIADSEIEAEVNQNKVDSNTVDTALRVSINSNIAAINAINFDYQDNDEIIRVEFQSADTTLDNRINALDINLTGDILNFTGSDTEIDLSEYKQSLSFANNEIKISGGVSINLSSIDTQLSENIIDMWANNNGYITSLAGFDWNALTDIPEGFADGIDNNSSDFIFAGWDDNADIGRPGVLPYIGSFANDELFAKYLRADGTWDNPLKDNEIRSLGYIKIATTNTILDGAITTEKINDLAVTTEKIADNAVTTEKIGFGTVTTENISNSSITTEKILAGAITNDKVSDINWDKISDPPIVLGAWIDGGPYKPTLVPVVNDTLEESLYLKGNGEWEEPVQDAKISALNYIKEVTTADFVDGSITTAKIEDKTIISADISANAVTNEKIVGSSTVSGAVTSAKIVSEAIETDKIAVGAVTDDKVSDINWGKISDRPIVLGPWINGGSYKPTLVPVVNDTVEESLYLKGNGEWEEPVQDAKISALNYIKEVRTADFVNGAVTTAKIEDETIVSSDISTNAVTREKIKGSSNENNNNNRAVTSGKIGDNQVITDKVADKAVDKNKIHTVSWGKLTGKPTHLPVGGSSVPSLVPQPPSNDGKFLRGNGTWARPNVDTHNYLLKANHPSHDNFEPSSHSHAGLQRKDSHSHDNLASTHSHNFSANNNNHHASGSHDANHYYNANGGWSSVPTSSGGSNRWGHFWYPEGTTGRVGSMFQYDRLGGANWMSFYVCNKQSNSSSDCIRIRNKNDDNHLVSRLYQGNWVANSDRRLKKNIETIKDALYKVQNIRGVIYQKKLDKTELGPIEIGVIAQELEDYVPEVIVKPADESEFLQVIYPQLNALLIEAIKELIVEKNNDMIELIKKLEAKDSGINKKIKNLKNENIELDKQIEILTNQIDQLELKGQEK
ncbi:MAG: hypothetical protein CMP21_08530 [Rickettsiales bacterium]|nr:hypothetical protein [Rickettsiales bacterium]|tara:strand:+ start:2848 stop:9087 length:6240 start_codon:yes stop_codon:yes gene_type:complete